MNRVLAVWSALLPLGFGIACDVAAFQQWWLVPVFCVNGYFGAMVACKLWTGEDL